MPRQRRNGANTVDEDAENPGYEVNHKTSAERAKENILGKKEIWLIATFVVTAVAVICIFSAALVIMVQVLNATSDTSKSDEWKANFSTLKSDYDNLAKTVVMEAASNIDELKANFSTLKSKFEDLRKTLRDNQDITYLLMLGFNLTATGRPGERYLYKKFDGTANFSTAEAQCVKIGCTLAMNVIRKLLFLNQVKQSTKTLTKTWFGYSDRKNESQWEWLDGSPENETLKWNTPPDDYKNEDCVEVVKEDPADSLALNDIKCSSEFSYLCEKKLPYSIQRQYGSQP